VCRHADYEEGYSPSTRQGYRLVAGPHPATGAGERETRHSRALPRPVVIKQIAVIKQSADALVACDVAWVTPMSEIGGADVGQVAL
jgi:hypothetical protein